MGLMRVGGGISGIIEYLIAGRKQGQELSRDELDERIVLYGDIEITSAIIGSMNVAGQKYLHITFSVKERDLPIEKFREIDEFIREKLFAAYGEDELNIYSELQRPKIKNVPNKTTGAWHERLDHIHYAIPQKNLITGMRADPIGVFDHNKEFFEAIQELANIKFGLASPKDNARVDISEADIIGRKKDVDNFKKGAFKDLKSELINDILVKDIQDYESFKKHLEGIGKVKVVNAGKDNEYLGVKVDGKPRFVNLQEVEFRKTFFELPEAERAQTLGAGHTEKPTSRMRPKRTEAEYEASVQDWVDRRSKEVRYLNSGSKLYKKYRDGTKEEKAEILAYYEQRAHAQRLKSEKKYDNQYREQGHALKRGRAAMAHDSGERIFAERAEQRALARAMGNDTEPGLAVPTFGEAPRFGDRVFGVSQGDMDGEQRRAALLVQADAHHDLHPRQPEDADHQMQRAAGSTGRINPATGRTSDTATAQLLRDEQEAARQEAGDKQPTIQDIKKYLNAERLLADLAESHKLRPEDYLISQAKDAQGNDSGARIRHRDGHHGSMQKYNVSDFLTKHLHLNWGEAQKVLVACYERQKDAVPIQKVASKPRADFWAEFKEDRRIKEIEDPGYSKQDWQRQLASERARKSVINDRYKHELARLKANPNLSPAQFEGQKGVERGRKVDALMDLGKVIVRERAELSKANSDTEQYRLWLQGEAAKGKSEKLVELRDQDTEPETNNKLFKSVIAAVDDKQPDTGKWLEDQTLLYRVERNGDVTYIRDGRELLLDTRRKVFMIDTSEETIERGLLLAALKWGGKMQLTGDKDFIRTAIEIAARKKMHIEFADPEHNAMLQDGKEKMRKGLEYVINKHAKELDAEEARAAERRGRNTPKADVPAPAPGQAGQAGQAPATPTPTEQPLQHQVVHAPPPEQDTDPEQEIDAPGL